MQVKRFTRSLLGLLLVGLFGYSLLFPSSMDGEAKPKNDRVYKGEVQLREVITDESLLNPFSAKTNTQEALYVFDFGAPAVKKYTMSGNLILEMGNGNGRGPGEFENPTDFDISPKGEIYVSDPVNGRVSHFAPDGEHISDYRTESRPHRVVALEDGYVIMTLSEEYMFEKYSEDDLKSVYETPSRYSLRESDAFEGFLASDEQEGIIYAGLWYGRLVGLDQSGSVRFDVPTLDGSPPPDIIRSRSGNTVTERVDRENATISSLNISVYNDLIYTLSRDYDQDRIPVIDAYNITNGEYFSSLRLEYKKGQIRDATVYGDKIYAVSYNGEVLEGDIQGFDNW